MKIPRVEENCTDFMNERRNMKGEFLLLHLFLCLVVLPSHIYGGDIGLGNLAEIFAQLAGGDGCVFKCPGGSSPKKNKKHKPTSDGCGSYGLKFILEHDGFEECCNKHDKCYDTCNRKREKCDKDFKECLYDVCHLAAIHEKKGRKVLKQCESNGDIMYAGALGLGCPAFKEAQRNACLCDGRTITKKEMKDLGKLEEL